MLLITFFIVCLVSGGFSFYASFLTLADPSDDRRWVIYVSSVIVPLFVAIVMYVGLRNHAKKAARSADPVTMTFDGESVEIDGPKANSKSRWTAYERVMETPDDFIFYIQPNVFFNVPKRFFDDSGEIERVKAFISENFRS